MSHAANWTLPDLLRAEGLAVPEDCDHIVIDAPIDCIVMVEYLRGDQSLVRAILTTEDAKRLSRALATLAGGDD